MVVLRKPQHEQDQQGGSYDAGTASQKEMDGVAPIVQSAPCFGANYALIRIRHSEADIACTKWGAGPSALGSGFTRRMTRERVHHL